MMFHLVTVFPINATEQEKYYITIILKKPQRVNVQQFLRHVEQLNTYIAQMLCFYNSPTFNATTKPENVPFMEAELESHVLRMCLLQWQGQYNLHKKGMMPIDLHLLLTSLEAIERACTREKAKLESSTKASHKGKNGKKQTGTKSTARVPKKVPFRSIATCVRSMGGGAYTMHNTKDCRRYEKEGKEKANIRAAKRAAKKPNPTRQNFAQLSKKLDKLEKTLKKLSKISKKCQYKNGDSNSV
jgi:hypothetical protein